ncbi:MAG: hypothetical protein CMP76_07570 [Flavobacterium sp.]|uniref:energy transducer TonB n=1 Tax=Flavobacterium sp. TaxID=239 RepID=UPI000C66F763|nr:energy transducer TonB [Flavobacterium sp.]MBF03140.1 hypothetical protein [Flavobacterium sp.]|tara:strand:+ start:3032 stop:3685 length:654 start_codon:yes stop_codon:yes gene_type:complete
MKNTFSFTTPLTCLLIAFFSFTAMSQNEIDSIGNKQGEWILSNKNFTLKATFKDNKTVGPMRFYENEKLVLEATEGPDKTYTWKLYTNEGNKEGIAKNNEEGLFRYFDLQSNEIDSTTLIKLNSIGEILPTYNGGINQFHIYIAQNIDSLNIKNEKFKVNFVINQNGKVTDVKIASSTNPNLNDRIIHFFENSPRWNPGFQRFRFVKVKMSIPLNLQ